MVGFKTSFSRFKTGNAWKELKNKNIILRSAQLQSAFFMNSIVYLALKS